MTHSRGGQKETKEAIAAEAKSGTSDFTAEPRSKLRPAGCRSFVRGELAKAMPTIAEELVRQATEGSVSHLTVLLKIGGFDLRPITAPIRGRGSRNTRRLLDTLRSRSAKATTGQDDQQSSDGSFQ